MRGTIAVLLILTSTATLAQPESAYIDRWCSAHNGDAEVTLRDGSRADCVTGTAAVEVERAANYKEGIGQALRYAMLTGKRAKMVVIVGPGDADYTRNLRSLINYYELPIDVVEIPK